MGLASWACVAGPTAPRRVDHVAYPALSPHPLPAASPAAEPAAQISPSDAKAVFHADGGLRLLLACGLGSVALRGLWPGTGASANHDTAVLSAAPRPPAATTPQGGLPQSYGLGQRQVGQCRVLLRYKDGLPAIQQGRPAPRCSRTLSGSAYCNDTLPARFSGSHRS